MERHEESQRQARLNRNCSDDHSPVWKGTLSQSRYLCDLKDHARQVHRTHQRPSLPSLHPRNPSRKDLEHFVRQQEHERLDDILERINDNLETLHEENRKGSLVNKRDAEKRRTKVVEGAKNDAIAEENVTGEK